MRTFKLIIKGMLLYMTTLVIMMFIIGIDSIYDQGYFFYGIMLIAVLIFMCYKTINKEELEMLTVHKYLTDSDEELK